MFTNNELNEENEIPMMYSGVTTMSAAERVQAEIKAKIQAKKSAVSDPSLSEAAAPAEPVNPFFTHDNPEPAGKVLLSSLVPTWEKRRKIQDVWVKVLDVDTLSDEARARVPSINSYYRPNLEALSQLAYAIEDTDTPSLLTGLPSVGKSSLVEYFCALTNRPFYRFNYNGTMDSSSLLGTQKATAGSTEWHDGMITEAIKVPDAVLLHDEWTFAPAEVIAAMQYLLERNGKLILADKPGTVADKTVYPAQGMRMVFADNTRGNGDTTGRFVGTQPQNSATIDRIGTFIEVNFLSENDEIAMLKGMYPQATDRLLKSYVQVANLSRNAYTQGNVSTIMSLRVLSSWIQHSLNLKDIEKALDIAFLNRFDSEAERQVIKGFLTVTMGRGR
jgi:cobaltochelatase CobS